MSSRREHSVSALIEGCEKEAHLDILCLVVWLFGGGEVEEAELGSTLYHVIYFTYLSPSRLHYSTK